MKQLKRLAMFLCLGSLLVPLTTSAGAWEYTAYPRWMQNIYQKGLMGARYAKMVKGHADQAQQLKMQIRQTLMYKVSKDFLNEVSPEESDAANDSEQLAEACKNGVGEGICVIAMQKQQKSDGGVTDEATSEYSVKDYAAGSPHTRLPQVYHEMEKQNSAAQIFLTKKYFVMLGTVEKELRTLSDRLATSASNATEVAIINTKSRLSMSKLKILSAQLDAINVQLKMIDQKRQYEAVKQNMEASGRDKDNQQNVNQ